MHRAVWVRQPRVGSIDRLLDIRQSPLDAVQGGPLGVCDVQLRDLDVRAVYPAEEIFAQSLIERNRGHGLVGRVDARKGRIRVGTAVVQVEAQRGAGGQKLGEPYPVGRIKGS